jgi:hypothetical protein
MNTYEQLAAFLGAREARRVYGIRATVIERVSAHAIGVKYHHTTVVLAYADGFFRLFSGGYHTTTTKSRINTFSSARVYQKNFDWFAADGIRFVEGIVIGPTGSTTLDYTA